MLCLYNMEMRNRVLETVQSYCSCFQTSIVIQVQLTYNVALVSCVQHSHSTSPHVMLCSQVELLSVTLQCCYVIFDVIPSAVPLFHDLLTPELEAYISPLSFVHFTHPSPPASIHLFSVFMSLFLLFVCFVFYVPHISEIIWYFLSLSDLFRLV